MNNEKVLKTLLAPVISEKSTLLSANNQYVFKVGTDSNKREIKQAIETLFGVTVNAVQTLNVHGKKKVFRGKFGKRNNWKKAIITVAEGQMIDISR